MLKSNDLTDLQGLLTDFKQALENTGINMNMDKIKMMKIEQISMRKCGKVKEKGECRTIDQTMERKRTGRN